MVDPEHACTFDPAFLRQAADVQSRLCIFDTRSVSPDRDADFSVERNLSKRCSNAAKSGTSRLAWWMILLNLNSAVVFFLLPLRFVLIYLHI